MFTRLIYIARFVSSLEVFAFEGQNAKLSANEETRRKLTVSDSLIIFFVLIYLVYFLH